MHASTTPGRARRISSADSYAVRRVLSGTRMAPAEATAIAVSATSTEFGAQTTTRSPGRTPKEMRPRAILTLRSRYSRKQRRTVSSISASRSGQRSVARATAAGMVAGMSVVSASCTLKPMSSPAGGAADP